MTAPCSIGVSVRHLAAEAHAVLIELGPGSIVGRHRAPVPQLFVAVRGSGWVSSREGERQPIEAGDAVLWEQGEEHESGSEEGMTALVLESDSLR